MHLTDGTATGGGAGGSGNVAFANIEDVTGTPFGDVITGNGEWNQLLGGDGNDTIDGRGGADQVWGGNGADTFVISTMSGYNLWIPDFAAGEDKLALDARVMPARGTTGNFTANDPRFYSAPGATAAHDADDRISYDSSGGGVMYDPDGTGPQAAQSIAVLAYDIVPHLSA